MPSAADYIEDSFVKLIFIGNSGAGKTGALTSLVKAGYKLKIIDVDRGLDALIHHVKNECPDKIDNIEYVTYRDSIKMTPGGPKVDGAPRAYVSICKALEKWPDDESDPATWGHDTILVLDSLTNVGRAAMQWAKATNPTAKEPRQWYKTAQDLCEDLIANLTSGNFGTNVIVISHIEITDMPDNTIKGFASAIGKALGPKLPRFFNTLLLSETSGTGRNVKRQIKTLPTAMIDVKNPVPMKMEASYPIETALATIFEKLKK